jgi:hypothetical protein
MEFINNARQALYQEKVFAESSDYKEYDPEKLALNPGSVPPLEPIFEVLEIKNRCCRMRILARTDFDKLYK